MKRILKWGVIVFVAISGLVLLASVALYSTGMEKLTRSLPNIPVETVSIPTDSDAVARGKHIATIWACAKCHGANLGGSLITSDPIDGIVPLFGSIPASNLTSGKGGIARSYTDADWVRAIRHGVKPNGRVEVLIYDYSAISDRDLESLIAYLKQIPPTDSGYADSNYGPLITIAVALGTFTPVAELMDHGARHMADPVPSATKEYGKYVAALCADCHGTNLVPPLQGNWKQEEFVRAVRTGALPNGKQIGPAMPSSTYGEMNDTELTALGLYLQNARSSQAR